MKKLLSRIAILILLLQLTACQEVKIYIEIPSQEEATLPQETQPASIISTATPYPFVTPEIPTAIAEKFDPSLYYFPFDALPQDITYTADNEKTFLVSYLNSPGNLLGIAHIREYNAYDSDLYITQDIIQCPIDVQDNMLQSGHSGNNFHPTSSALSLGQNSMLYHQGNEISYRFYQRNMMVVVDLRGSHPFVTEENAYNLAKMIFEKLPESFPIPTLIESPSMEYHSELSAKYFRTIELVACQEPYTVTDPVVETDLGYCFHTDIIELIQNLKVGIYDKRYGKLVYMKEFLYTPQMGEWTTGLFFPVWGYGWQHFHEGEYEAMFWVDDRLVQIIPYTLIPEQAGN